MNPLLDYFPNCMVGFTNVINDYSPRARAACRSVQQIPLDRIIMETDAPYFLPSLLRVSIRLLFRLLRFLNYVQQMSCRALKELFFLLEGKGIIEGRILAWLIHNISLFSLAESIKDLRPTFLALDFPSLIIAVVHFTIIHRTSLLLTTGHILVWHLLWHGR